LERLPVACSDPWISLQELSHQLGLSGASPKSHSLEQLFAAEQNILASDRVIPLFHLPVSYAATIHLRNWQVTADGRLDLASAWWKSPKP
jgi:MarR-like DNA-binding transcriptional regulator SgrR of sgrS sRNA